MRKKEEMKNHYKFISPSIMSHSDELEKIYHLDEESIYNKIKEFKKSS